MVAAADTPIFREQILIYREFPCEVPDNGGPDNRGSTVFQY